MPAPAANPVASHRRPADTGRPRGRIGCVLALLVLVAAMGQSLAARAADDPSQALRSQYQAMAEQLDRSPWGRPLLVRSEVQPNWLQGEVHAVVDHAFADVHRELGAPQNWCDVVSLHPNTKFCRVSTEPTGIRLQVRIGMSGPQKIDDAVPVSLRHRVAASMPHYTQLELLSRDGPMGTSDYRIRLEALALPNARTFLHLTYSYTFNGIARMAMQAYLATFARDKVGFTITGQAEGRPVFVAGLRGHVERNTMRYFLAIASTLATMHDPAPTRAERRLQAWYDAAQQYPRQLHELERDDYLQMKRDEMRRQQGRADNAGTRRAQRHDHLAAVLSPR